MKTFIIATAIGGVMESPGYTYVNIRTVEANSLSEAIEKYYKIFPRDYWCAREVKAPPLEEEQPKKLNAHALWEKELGFIS